MSKKILIINGNPYEESYNSSLVDAYKKGANAAGANISEIRIVDLDFNPNLLYGYHKRMELEPDLIQAWEKIKWAEHIVFVFPIWWGGMPGVMKSFFDRLFLPGFAFKYKENSVWWDKFLVGKTARIITTMDTPNWYFWLVYRNAGIHQLKKNILEFCGVKPVKVTKFGQIRFSTDAKREKYLTQIEDLGKLFS